MSTRSIIILKEDDVYHSIYCHNDGYPSHVGKLLEQHYDTPEKIRELISLGDLSCLGESLDFSHTIAYHRDCGEGLSSYQTSELRKIFKRHGDCDYFYLFSEGNWKVSTHLITS